MSDKKPLFGILAGEPEIIGERCADGGKCHHRCTDTCSRRSTCAPLSGSGLRFDWSVPALRADADLAGDRFEVPVSGWSGPAHDEREAVERFSPTTSVPHSGRASEVEAYMTEDDGGEYMTVSQHERIVARLSRPAQTAPQPVSSALADLAGDRFEAPVAGWSGPTEPAQAQDELLPCPFCGNALEVSKRRYNPHARCVTENCKGAQLPLLNIDQPDDVARWNTRPAQTAPQPVSSALAAVTAELDRLQRNLNFTEQWYAERFERLADLGKSAGCWDVMAAIIANGTADPYEPPTYAQQLVRANHRADVAERERDQLRAEVETLRKDAERYRWASSGLHEAETLASIVNCHGGYAEKVAERVDVYREAAMAAKDPEPERRMDAKVKAAAISLAPERSGRIYIAGPMTGLPDFNFPAFNDMADILRGLGYHVENPAEHGVVEGAEWADYLRYDIARLATCEALVLLPGWRHSRGALLEVHIAKALGIQIMFAEVFSRFDAEDGA